MVEDGGCLKYEGSDSYFTNFNSSFTEQCVGQEDCLFSVPMNTIMHAGCINQLEARTEEDFLTIKTIYECEQESIRIFDSFDRSKNIRVSRPIITMIVVGVDALITILFLIVILRLKGHEQVYV